MAEGFEAASIYIDLDSLFDMRLVALGRMGEAALEAAFRDDYLERVTDEFAEVDVEAFKTMYAARDAGWLVDAKVTPVVRLLHEFGHRTLQAVVNSPFRRQPRIVINAHPYILTEEQANSIIVGVRAVTKGLLDIELVSLSYADLTPQYVKAQFVQLIMYSYWEWLEEHAANGNWHKTQCPQVRLYGPQLIKSKEAVRQLYGIDAFSAIETHFSPFVQIVLLPIRHFSVDLAKLQARMRQDTTS